MARYKFKCKTHEAYIFKNMMELLQHNVKIGCFEISSSGIRLRMMDSNRRMLFDICLDAHRFQLYTFNDERPVLYVGVNMNHMYKLLRTIKKKDSLHMFIYEHDMTNLNIEIIPKEKSPPVTLSCIKIQNIQNLDIMLPEGYEKSLLVSSSGFSKMCKDMITISNVMMVNIYTHYVRFCCHVGHIYSREVSLGETDAGEDESEAVILYMDEFDTEIFSRVTKISGLHCNLHIFFSPDLPLMFRTEIGNIGTMSVYIKSKKQILCDTATPL
jgi:proliferating cell nuclear antigen PCNA